MRDLTLVQKISLSFQVLTSDLKSVAATFVSAWNTQPTYASTDFRTNVVKRYYGNDLIFSCINKTTLQAGQVKMDVWSGDSKEKLPDHPLSKLLKRPNKYMSETDLYEAILTNFLLSGRCVLEKERNLAGDVIGLYPLRPDWVHTIPDVNGGIRGFLFGPSGHTVYIPYTDVVDIPWRQPFSPIVPFKTLGPVSIAAKLVDTDSQATDFIKLIFEKGGVPPGILKTKQKLIESQVEVLRRRWAERYGGYTNWMEPAILDADAEYQRIGLTFNEMGMDGLDRRSESRICMVLDIPPIIVGAFVGIEKSSYDNYLTARKAWWEDSLLPKFGKILDRLKLELSSEYADNPELKWDLSGVEALQDNKELLWRRAADAFRTGALTINMYLEEIGMPNIGPQGDIFLRPLAYEAVPFKGTSKAISNSDSLTQLKAGDPPTRDDYDKLLQGALQRAFAGSLESVVEEIDANGIKSILEE